MNNPFKYLTVPITLSREQALAISRGEHCTLTFKDGKLQSFENLTSIAPMTAKGLHIEGKPNVNEGECQ